MAKDRERDRDRDNSDTAGRSQSNHRPALSHRHTSDSIFQHHPSLLQQQHLAQQLGQHAPTQRPKQQKHVVGGGTTGRLHARVPSSKALHKSHSAVAPALAGKNANARRHSSPSPDPNRVILATATAAAAATSGNFGSAHRRSSSDLRLSGNSSTANLKKNVSASSLRRNKSHGDVISAPAISTTSKRRSGGVPLKRTLSNPAAAKKGHTKNQVHFALGNDGDEEDDGDEWVDASASASPYVSRRGSVVSSTHSANSKQPDDDDSPDTSDAAKEPASAGPPSPQRVASRLLSQQQHQQQLPSSPLRPSPQPRSTSYAGSDLPTSRLLQRGAPQQSAAPKMSTDLAAGEASSVPRRLRASGYSGTTVYSTPQAAYSPGDNSAPGVAGQASSAGDAITSRFVTTSSHGSSGNQGSGGGSFYGPDSASLGGGGMNDLRQRALGLQNGYLHNGEPSSLTSEEDAGGVTTVARPVSRAHTIGGHFGGGPYTGAPAAKSRTQQKLNLQRASSTLEPNNHHHHQGGPVSGPLVGGAGWDTRDPRIGKILERTGMEYLVVRRYQNPVARSLNRLAQLPGADRSRRIPRPNGSSAGPNGSTRQEQQRGAASHNRRIQSMSHDLGSAAGNGNGGIIASKQRPTGPRRVFSSIRASGANSSLETDDGAGGRPLHEALSGASLVDGDGDDDGTVALLRNLWEKNMDLSASQD